MEYLPTEEDEEEFLCKQFVTTTSYKNKRKIHWEIGERGKIYDVGGNFALYVIIGDRIILLYPEDIKIIG